MNRNKLFWLALLCFVLMSFSLFAQFAGGSGTEQDPYQVATAEHLNNVRNYSSSWFIQTADIDLGVAPWNQGEGWMPLDGDSHEVNNLYINRPENEQIGLFSQSNQGTILNIGVINVNVIGYSLVGGLAGINNWGNIRNCYSSGNVIGEYHVGGMVGGSSNGSIYECYYNGNVLGDTAIGGLVGYTESGGSISNSYANGSVSGFGPMTGGLIGLNQSSVVNCFSRSRVSGGWSDYGGLIGQNINGSIINSYWDFQYSEQTGSAGGEGRTTLEMIYPHSTNTFVGWDWRIWKPDLDHSINVGYPYLRHVNEVASQVPEAAVCMYPLDQAVSVLPNLILQWNAGFSPNNADPPSGFKLWLGTDNPPSNICEEQDLGYQLIYDPSPDLEPNTTYYWKIVPYNAVGESQNCPVWSFTTYDPNFALTYPNGGELWQSGTTRTIIWTENASPQVALSISFDNGSQWIPIAEVDGTEGYYHYQVPAVNSANCRIKIVNMLDGSQFDTCDTSFSISSSSSQPKVLLSYPSAANIYLKVGDSVNLTWTRQNVIAVALEYSADDGQTWTEIVSNLQSDSYLWIVPDNPSTECRIKVRSQANSEVLDISDNVLSIGKVLLMSPNGGEVITGDYSRSFQHTISWSAPGISHVNIEYSADGGNSWILIKDHYNGSMGGYIWYLPGVPSINYLIRISNASNSAINDVSDAPFSIRNPIKLTNANGGGFITHNSMFNIRWKIQDIIPTAQIYWEYSLDNGAWTRINTSAVSVSNESMYWFINTGLDDSVWLRAVEHGTARVVGKSEAPFRVTDNILQLIEPNGGEEYAALTTQTISWDHDGLTNLSIHFSADDGDTWSQIAANMPASALTYSWIVPETPSVNCRIKLQDQTYPWMVLESDLPFTISPLQIIAPTVDFSADILEGDIPLAVQFTEDVNPGVGNVASRLWDFGDGNTSDQTNPLHTYTVAGTYTVSLTVTNDFEGTTTETKTDYITALPNTPRIELLSASSLNYGVVYLGDTSPTQIIVVKNIGTAPMIISSVSYYLANLPCREQNFPFPYR